MDWSSFFTERDVLVIDLDGTIANTEPYHFEAHAKVVAEYGITLTPSDVQRYVGRTDEQIYPMISEDFRVAMNVPRAIEDKVDAFLEIAKARQIQPYPVMERLIRTAPNTKILLTNQRQRIVDAMLAQWDLRASFSQVISLQSSTRTKVEVIQVLGYPLKSIVVFEDSPRTLRDAVAHGIRCVAVRTDMNRDLLPQGVPCVDMTQG